jgi:hypothetical protein
VVAVKYQAFYLRGEDLEWFEWFKKIAEREGKTLSELIRDVLKEYAENHGYANPNHRLDDFVKGLVFEAMPTLGHNPSKWDWENTSDRMLAKIWCYAKEWLSCAEHEIQRRKGGPITIRQIEIP